MREPIKTEFTWDDLNDSFEPCEHCGAILNYPVCDDGATSSACNHCAYNIIAYLLTTQKVI